ncbi:MAG TPA: class I SAM-dependent methyltransferase [Stellaceae bacterium]|nr:class I SAM-dependent methyltransferase [Stellaceae bacterium]
MSVLKSSIKRALPPGAYNYLREQKNLWACRKKRLVPQGRDRSQVFASFYGTSLWGSHESSSGPGSTLEQTKRLRAALPTLLKKYRISTMLDIACGDWNWMSHLHLPLTRYIGADLVAPLIERNQDRYGDQRHSFLALDAVMDDLPKVDLIFSRDTLDHLPLADVLTALRNFKSSGSTYLLMTHYPAARRNHDIRAGNWRPLNFLRAPFRLPPPIEIIDEGPYEFTIIGPRTMALWALDRLPMLAPKTS